MTRVCLGDVAREIKQKAPVGQELPTVGLEHLDPGEVELAHWGEGTETTFTKAFARGQVLFGRRRAYLRKAAVAPFDGICSGDITVIAARNGLSPRLLPFIIQNDALFEHAVTNSAGSLSPRVKWQSLSQFEFELPDIDGQEELADILWAAQETRSHYKQLIAACDDVVKSRFVEMFGDPVDGVLWAKQKLSDLYQVKSSKRIYAREQTKSGVSFLRLADVGSLIDSGMADSGLFISEERFEELKVRGQVPAPDDVLVTARGTLGRCYVIKPADHFYFQDGMITWLAASENSPLPSYLLAIFDNPHFIEQLSNNCSGTTVRYLSISYLANVTIPVAPLALQEQFASFASQVDKSKFAIQKALGELNATTKIILNQELGLGDV